MATTHAICVQARHEPCNYCHAERECPCTADRCGVHLCRVCLAADHHRITMSDEASVIYGDTVAGWDLILDVVPS